MQPDCVYAVRDKLTGKYRFHINHYTDFCHCLNTHGITEVLREVVVKPLHTPTKVELKILPHWKDKPKQTPAIEFVTQPGRVSTFIDLPPGAGKTFCAFRAAAIEGHRVAIVVRAGYVDRWLKGIKETYELEDGDVLVVQGSKHLSALFEMQEQGILTAKFIIFSNRTLGSWFKLYKNFGKGILEMGYHYTPENFFEKLGIGYRIIDEVHQDFHFNFILDLYTHLPKSVSLSGTLTNEDDHVKQMMNVAYPKVMRYEDHEYERYIDMKAWFYTIANIRGIRISEPGSTTYSHNAFEKSVMKQPKVLAAYLQMIKDAITAEFVPAYKPGNKLLVFASTTAFCTLLVDYLRKQFPMYTTERYVGSLGDPDENLMEPVIRVSTLGSAGTAIDIPGLYMSLLTVAIGSSVSNIQGLGRTREMKDGQSPKFVTLVCQDVPQHLRYHEKRRTALNDRIRSFDSRYYNRAIG